ncbi:uncharacterized protein B0J16DRAFT_403010 [Fusarium flagelliforme]|uniref:uncharacterized protein n=1 Tax=Fusarium flagelliforme TaxID=2675880 RepID=UPI001E8E6A7F|nr:uncharacterized protein B0J16DRAFT_403010 [Fusarium flagelliforme]KAH7179683.1 hypothetical protein B0J16DRAFT_403010 [Fusarium flagelliforme]
MHPTNRLPESLYPTLLMIDRDQCQTHTRTPWGTSEHRINHRIRYAFMGALSIVFIVVTIVAEHSSENALPNLASSHQQVLVETTDDKEELYHPPFHAKIQDCQAFCQPNDTRRPLKACQQNQTRFSSSGCAQSDECIVAEKHPAAVNSTQYGHDVGGGCCPDGTICAREGCLSLQTSLRKHSMPRATIDGLFHGDKPEAVQTGIKFGEVGVVKSSTSARIDLSLGTLLSKKAKN